MPNSFQGVLANIPGLAGYLAGEQNNQQQQMGQLNQIGVLSQLQARMQQQQQMVQQQQEQARARAQEQQFRTEIAGAKTPEEQAAVAARYAGPKDILGHIDRQTTAANTKEMAKARLAQSAIQGDRMFQLQMQSAKTAADKAAVEAQWKQFRGAVEQERLKYDTGSSVPSFMLPPMPSLAPEAPAAPQAGGVLQLPAGEAMQTTAPNMGAALNQFATGGGVPRTVTIEPGQAPAPALSPVPPQGVLAQLAAPPDNLDARDRGAWARGPVIPIPQAAPAPATPPAPQMPQFTGSPRQIAEARNKWMAAQTKQGEGTASNDVINAIAQGRMQMPTGFALRSPYWQDVIERVAKVNPNFDAGVYGARAAARRTFASGPEARNVTAMNTLIGHLGTMDEAMTALENQDLRAYNVVQNRLRKELGDDRIANFETAKKAVASEAMRVFRQVGASTQEMKDWEDAISLASSPAQMRGTIRTLGELLEKRIEAIEQQYKRTVEGDGNPAKVDPRNRTLLDQLRGGAGTGGWSIRPK